MNKRRMSGATVRTNHNLEHKNRTGKGSAHTVLVHCTVVCEKIHVKTLLTVQNALGHAHTYTVFMKRVNVVLVQCENRGF